MRNNRIIFFRHAETKLESERPVSLWDLTSEGAKVAEEILDSGEFDGVDVIYSSSEPKALQTINYLAERVDKEVVQVKDLGEINRDSGGLLSDEEYKETKRKVFADFNYSAHGWETANSALERFKAAVEKIDSEHSGETIMIASHGTVMVLYFADLLGKLDDLYSFWDQLGFCDHWIVENGKVVLCIREDE